MATDLDRVVARLRQIEAEKRAVSSDQELEAALDPFRGKGPLRVRCGKRGCSWTLSWWAFPVAGTHVVFQAHGPRKPHLQGEGIPSEQLRPQPPPPFDDWSVGHWDGMNPSPLADPSGAQQRLTFKCQKCGSAYTLTMARMIQFLAQALARNQPEIVLPHGGRRTRK
jgi:hypothetical protein